jgi:hypothetical protein
MLDRAMAQYTSAMSFFNRERAALEPVCRREVCAVTIYTVLTNRYRDGAGEDVRYTCLLCGACASSPRRPLAVRLKDADVATG